MDQEGQNDRTNHKKGRRRSVWTSEGFLSLHDRPDEGKRFYYYLGQRCTSVTGFFERIYLQRQLFFLLPEMCLICILIWGLQQDALLWLRLCFSFIEKHSGAAAFTQTRWLCFRHCSFLRGISFTISVPEWKSEAYHFLLKAFLRQ